MKSSLLEQVGFQETLVTIAVMVVVLLVAVLWIAIRILRHVRVTRRDTDDLYNLVAGDRKPVDTSPITKAIGDLGDDLRAELALDRGEIDRRRALPPAGHHHHSALVSGDTDNAGSSLTYQQGYNTDEPHTINGSLAAQTALPPANSQDEARVVEPAYEPRHDFGEPTLANVVPVSHTDNAAREADSNHEPPAYQEVTPQAPPEADWFSVGPAKPERGDHPEPQRQSSLPAAVVDDESSVQESEAAEPPGGFPNHYEGPAGPAKTEGPVVAEHAHDDVVAEEPPSTFAGVKTVDQLEETLNGIKLSSIVNFDTLTGMKPVDSPPDGHSATE